ncbi:MAG TPA: BrxA family protein [Ktedonobacteraceae bacterium]|jgi:hypothetical protein
MVANAAPYSSKIIRAGALLPDTKLLLAHWHLAVDVQANVRRIQQENLFGKASRSRVAEILAIFKQRYLGNPQVLAALVTLVQADMPATVLDPILYFLTVQADPLLRAAVTEVLAPLSGRGQPEIHVTDIEDWLRKQIANGKTQGTWTVVTTNRAARSILATLRDFHLLQGQVKKQLASLYLPITSFAFIAFLLSRTQRSGDRLLHDQAWQVFFLSEQAVEHSFLEAHQEQLLEYHAAGRVIRISFPATTLEEYAHALTRRAH